MKILHTVQRYFPEVGGSEEVVKQLSEYLVSFGHEVTVATAASPERLSTKINGVAIESFHCSGNSVEGLHGDIDRYREFLANVKADVMMNYAAQIWSTDAVFDLLPSLPAKRVLVPCGYSRLHDPMFAEYYRRMPAVLANYDKAIYLSENYIDTDFGRRHGLINGVVIPNAASEKEFSGKKNPVFRTTYGLDNRPVVLNVSNHSGLKNHAFFWKCVNMIGSDRVQPVMIGNAFVSSPLKWLKECYGRCRFDAKRLGGLFLEHLPREKVVEAYQHADIFLFGSKVECSPLVMFEAFASKTLFITTNCGNVSDYSDIVCIVHNEQEAVGIVNDYINNPERYQDRLQKGFDLYRNHLNWKTIALEYESLYSSLLR